MVGNGAVWKIFNDDAVVALKRLPRDSVHCVVTSPPYYWLRDYGVDGQIGLEDTVDQYVSATPRYALFCKFVRVLFAALRHGPVFSLRWLCAN